MAIGSSLSNLFQTAGQNKTQTGTGYTNLNRFLGANQGNQLGQKVAGNLQSQVGGVQAQLGQQKTEFEKEADKNRLDTDANKQARDAVVGRFSSASSSGGDLADDDVNKFTQFRSGQYAGPQGLQDTSALSTQAQQFYSIKKLTDNQSNAYCFTIEKRSRVFTFPDFHTTIIKTLDKK